MNPDIKISMAIAIELLKESRDACAACFRVIAATIEATNDPTIADWLEKELKRAGVRDGFGVRMQNFIADSARLPDTCH